MWGWVGALCLSWWHQDLSGFRDAEGSYRDEDKHKAPSSTQTRPLSLQDGDGRITHFGRHNASGNESRPL